MRILYAIQGTGNGHVSRAREIIPHLETHGQVDLLISGRQVDVQLPWPVLYRKAGVSFTFGKNGGVDTLDTARHFKPFRLWKDIKELPVTQYDLVISDYEPISAWACRKKGKHCVALSHQAAYLSPKTPRPAHKDRLVELLYKWYAPAPAYYGFHFEEYDNFIFKPVIRGEIRALTPTEEDHISVYLPAYDDQYLCGIFKQLKEVRWQVFSKHCKQPYQVENVFVEPVSNERFNQSLASSSGLMTGGGFESPAEALFLGKKLFILPMKGQYEQHCNAEGIRKLGMPITNDLNNQTVPLIRDWLKNYTPIKIDYPDQTAGIIKRVIQENLGK